MKFLLIINLIFAPIFIFGQIDSLNNKDVKKEYKNNISVNTSSFIEKIFGAQSKPDLNNSFLYYTRSFGCCFARVGINGWNTKNTQVNVLNNEEIITNDFNASLGLGFYFSKKLSKKFEVSYGLNMFTAYNDSSVTYKTSFDKVRDYSISNHYGLAPGVMLTYKINKRISAFAEYTMPIKMVQTREGTDYSLFPDNNVNDKNYTRYSLQIYNPISIYLSCSF